MVFYVNHIVWFKFFRSMLVLTLLNIHYIKTNKWKHVCISFVKTAQKVCVCQIPC